ncbi:MAG: hypothetical protein LUG47_07135 [Clostridiales bacterium]|nr:hypothetical protein [Clostridiales bacterium]
MKRPYVAPQLEVEMYLLSTSIASNCVTVVYNGPVMETAGYYTACKSYLDTLDEDEPMPTSEYNVNFYDSSCCDCYTTGSGNYWAS